MSSFGKHTLNPGWKHGDNWMVCDVCGFEMYASEAKERWDGALVCPEDYEVRHPQDFVKAMPDDMEAKMTHMDGTESDTVDLSAAEEAEGYLASTTFGNTDLADSVTSGTSTVPTVVAPHYEGTDSSNTNPQNNSVNQQTDGDAADVTNDPYSSDVFKTVTFTVP